MLSPVIFYKSISGNFIEIIANVMHVKIEAMLLGIKIFERLPK